MPSTSSFSRGAGFSGIGFWKIARHVFSALTVAVDDFGLHGGGVGLYEVEAMLDFNCCRSNSSFGGDKSRIGESVIFKNPSAKNCQAARSTFEVLQVHVGVAT